VKIIGKLLYRILSIIIAIPIGRAVSKLAEQAWVAARPNDPPKDPRKADTGWADALTWAVITGISAALSKLLTSKGAAGAWRAIIGTDPPGYEQDPKKQQVAS
jgi:hypothetical protein